MEGNMKKTSAKKVIATLGTILVLLLTAGPGIARDIGIWVGYGWGFSNSGKQYEQRVMGDSLCYVTRTMRDGMDIRVRFSSKKSPVGYSFELSRQSYHESDIELYQGSEQWRYGYNDWFVYFGGIVDYSFFPKKKLDPYVGVGLLKLLYLDIFGSGPPEYPANFAVKLLGGVRYKLRTWANVDVSANYLPANGIVSLRLGLELIL